MRIITGKYRNKPLLSPAGINTRPTTDKMRESMFDVIASKYFIEDAEVLDLFCGTGALGIEALSRGAADCVFVDKSRVSVSATRKNLEFVKEKTEVYNTDWRVAVRKLEGRSFDLIFIDPPYAKKLEREVVDEIAAKGILSAVGCIVVEHSSENQIEYNESVFDVYRKRYSGTSVDYLSFVKITEDCCDE